MYVDICIWMFVACFFFLTYRNRLVTIHGIYMEIKGTPCGFITLPKLFGGSMKKVSTLLLTGILGTSMMFAGFTGTATLENELMDLDDHGYGFNNATELDATFDLVAATGEAKGEGDIYAEVNATLNVAVTLEEGEDGAAWDTVTDDVTISFDSAKVIGEGWSVSILGVNGPVDYAADTIANDDDGDAYNYSATDSTTAGVAVCLDDLATVSVGYAGDLDVSTAAYFALEAAEVELAEGITAQVAGSVYYDQAAANVGAGSVKVAYAKDDMSASVAADFGYETGVVDMDAVLNVAVAPLTVDAYYGTKNTNTDFLNAADVLAGDDSADIADNAKMLNVKVAADLNDFDVPVTLTVKGLDLVTARDLKASADVTLSEELSACVSGGYGLVSKDWNAGLSATYAVDAYTAKAAFGLNSDKELSASASVESTTLVNGATLCLAWADANDLTKVGADGVEELGSVTASCSIAF